MFVCVCWTKQLTPLTFSPCIWVKIKLHGPIAWQKFKDNLESKLQVNSRRLHKVRFNKSQVNVKLKLQVTGRRLHEASLTSLRLSLLTDGLYKTILANLEFKLSKNLEKFKPARGVV